MDYSLVHHLAPTICPLPRQDSQKHCRTSLSLLFTTSLLSLVSHECELLNKNVCCVHSERQTCDALHAAHAIQISINLVASNNGHLAQMMTTFEYAFASSLKYASHYSNVIWTDGCRSNIGGPSRAVHICVNAKNKKY